MKQFLVICVSIFATTFLAFPPVAGGWAWDLNNALGFVALAGMLYLTVPFRGVRSARAHEHFSYAVLGIALIHAFWFLIVDGPALAYIKAGAPIYMWAGIISVLLLSLSVYLSSLPARPHIYSRYTSFRYWHRLLAIFAIVGATYHIVMSGFYLETGYQSIIFVVIVAVISFNRRLKLGIVETTTPRPLALAFVGAIAAIIFASIRNGVQ